MYQKTQNDSVIRIEDNAVIPAEVTNIDYQIYLEWLSEGNTPSSIPKPSHKEITLSRIQNIEALSPFTHRILRDLSEILMQIVKQSNISIDPVQSTRIITMLDIESQIAKLRMELSN